MNNTFSRVTSFILVIVLTISLFSTCAIAADNDFEWEIVTADGNVYMPWRPVDNYVSEQNPPSFTWPNLDNSDSFELIICSDKELKDVKYHKTGLKNNYYIFDELFETGVIYYWAVRPTGSKLWSTPRRFRVDPDAYEFAIPSTDELIKMIPQSHPRIWVTPDKLEEFRNYKRTNEHAKVIYDYVLARARNYVKSGNFPSEPVKPDNYESLSAAEQAIWQQSIRPQADTMLNVLKTCAYAYLLMDPIENGKINEERREIGEFAKAALLELATWSWEDDAATSMKSQDQVHRLIVAYGAMSYDWIYDLLSESDKKIVLNMILERARDMIHTHHDIKRTPFASHGWTCLGYNGIAFIATLGELLELDDNGNQVDRAGEWLGEILEIYYAINPPWSYQDGGWSQGQEYWMWSTEMDKEFMHAVSLCGLPNIFGSAWQINEKYQMLYNYPAGSYSTFGDVNMMESGAATMIQGYQMAAQNQDGLALWAAESFGGSIPVSDIYYPLAPMISKVNPTSPYTLPLAREFHDIGWVSMMSDIESEDRIHMMFKSSQFGSYSHSMADQNSFALMAYGEPLSIKGGYYDFDWSTHQRGYSALTHAHNNVTMATSKGQPDHDYSAKGRLTNFLHHQDLDLASGNATESYKGGLDNFERNIIYIRPDIFVIIDDLKANEGKTEKWEWWLHSQDPISMYEDQSGVHIEKNDASLDASMKYPKDVKAYYSDLFAGSDMTEYKTQISFTDEESKNYHVWFETEELEQTKAVVTLDVHKTGTEVRNVNTEYYENCIKLIFEDGTVVVVNLGESNETITLGDLTFTGVAVVYTDETIMLVSGTSLQWGDTKLVQCENQGSVVMGKNELGISTYVDNKVSINTDNDYITKLESVTDYNGRPIGKEYGITMENGMLYKPDSKDEYELVPEENAVTFMMEQDNYSLMLNGKVIESGVIKGFVNVIIDGIEKAYEISGYQKRDGRENYKDIISIPKSKYLVINKDEELNFGNVSIGQKINLENVIVDTTKSNATIELQTLPVKFADVEVFEDHEAKKSSISIFTEAENYTGEIATGASVYTTRPFLSGGAGVTLFNTPGTTMKYTLNVTETGEYDFAVKYVAGWDGIKTVRTIRLNGAEYEFELPATIGYGSTNEEWCMAVAKCNAVLEPGTYEIVLEAIDGSWNMDWLGLVKKK